MAPVVVIDSDGIGRDDEIEAALAPADVHIVRDWFELRRDWERHGRHRANGGRRLVLVIRDPTLTSPVDLPFDVERATTVRTLRLSVPPEVRAAVLGMDDVQSDMAVDRVATTALDPVDAVLTTASHMPSVRIVGTPLLEFQVALRLVEHDRREPVLRLARGAFSDPLAVSLLQQPSDLGEVQRAWNAWVADPSHSRWSGHMRAGRAELIDLLMAGRLQPSERGDADVPPWATVGVIHESPATRVAALLDAQPESATSYEEWVRTARWWGDVRSGLALVNPADSELESLAWDWWRENDANFLAWMRSNYGAQLTRSWAGWPVSLDKVQPFLARRLDAPGRRLLLLVLDGMGFTQWTRIREMLPLRVLRSGGVFAMLPTLTEVSRQAIAAGALPLQFSDSLRWTSKESARWATAWSGRGVTTAWVRIDGARSEELEVVPFGTVEVIGLVLSATDELMHSAELLGDIGLHAGLEAWVRSGVLRQLFANAAEHGYETWVTADHGNLAVDPGKEPREGAFVERAGTRARRYASKALRDAAIVEGVIWDDLPGYPPDESERLLFAPGRTGWGQSRLSHGGLSLDEVMVPLVQVELVL